MCSNYINQFKVKKDMKQFYKGQLNLPKAQNTAKAALKAANQFNQTTKTVKLNKI